MVRVTSDNGVHPKTTSEAVEIIIGEDLAGRVESNFGCPKVTTLTMSCWRVEALRSPAFECHGWISLRATAEATDDEPPLRLDEMQAFADELAGYALMTLRPLNGATSHVGGNPNRRGTCGRAIIDLMVKIGQLAPGSHGLLYVYDDEGPQHDLDFQVFRLVRGCHRTPRHASVTGHPQAGGRVASGDRSSTDLTSL